MFNHDYPYTNNHELNLDWLIKTVEDTVKQFADVKQTFEDAKVEFEEAKLEFEALKTRFNELLSEFGDIKQAFEAFKEEVIALIPDEIRMQVRPVLEAMVTDGTLQQLLVDATGSMSNRNLLDNPWFTVNQRGLNEYSGNIYTVDRWKGSANTIVKVFDDYIELSNPTSASSGNSIVQTIEGLWDFLKGKNVTLSINANSDINFVTTTIPNVLPSSSIELVKGVETWGNYSLFLTNTGLFRVNAYLPNGGSVNIKAVKLELGSVSTLANDVAPNYAEELVKCKRYFQRIKTLYPYGVFGTALRTSGDDVRAIINIIPMRIIPILTYSGEFELQGTGNLHDVTSFNINTNTENAITLNCTTTGVTDNLYWLRAKNDATARFDFSADL